MRTRSLSPCKRSRPWTKCGAPTSAWATTTARCRLPSSATSWRTPAGELSSGELLLRLTPVAVMQRFCLGLWSGVYKIQNMWEWDASHLPPTWLTFFFFLNLPQNLISFQIHVSCNPVFQLSCAYCLLICLSSRQGHSVHTLPAWNLPRTPGVAPQLPDHDLWHHWHVGGQCLAAGRGNGRRRGHAALPQVTKGDRPSLFSPLPQWDKQQTKLSVCLLFLVSLPPDRTREEPSTSTHAVTHRPSPWCKPEPST